MMREIKFRIWDRKNKRWFHGATDRESQTIKTDAINLFGEVITMGEILIDQHTDQSISLERLRDLVPVQFTGLNDKAGVDIYEGDIIKDSTTNSRWAVTWNAEAGGWTDEDNNPHKYGLYKSLEKCLTVIGNVYETPKLLA